MDNLQPQSDLQKANQILYQQNYELSIKNQTLSTLRKLYDATLSSVELPELTQQIVDAITGELKFTAALISIVNIETNQLVPVAINMSPNMVAALTKVGRPLNELGVSLDFVDNLAVNCLKTKTRQTTTNLLDILDPHVTQEVADQVENISGVRTIIVYPLYLAQKPVGVLHIGLPKKADDMSRAERETLEQLIDLVTLAIDRSTLYQDLKNANYKLTQLSKLKDEFVYLASHELRTPLTAIKSYTWMSLNGKAEPLGPKNQKNLEVVYNSTERLIHLVNEMLDLSRIESGKAQLTKSQVNIPALLNELTTEFAARSTEKQLQLVTQSDGEYDISADKDKVLQILENLVGNSFKFTPPGGKVSVTVTKDNNFLVFKVSDTGKGIAQEDVNKLFAKFGRLDNSLVTTPESGTGLGLYITKQYVEMHGGQITVESQLGSGTTFTFTLPA